MEKYKVNEHIREAVIRAATDALSFKRLGESIQVPGTLLQLIADGHSDEVNAETLKALMPKIIIYLPGNEKKKVISFLKSGERNK